MSPDAEGTNTVEWVEESLRIWAQVGPHTRASQLARSWLRLHKEKAELERALAEAREENEREMSLFQTGDFSLHSGARSIWKIECDALTPEDWRALAAMAAEILPPFGCVVGVPRGGLPFADALTQYVSPSPLLLIADDVLTTGASMEEMLAAHDSSGPVIGVCVFARGPAPEWVTPLFRFAGGPAAPWQVEGQEESDAQPD